MLRRKLKSRSLDAFCTSHTRRILFFRGSRWRRLDRFPYSRLLPARDLLCFLADERIIQRRERIELCRFLEIFPRFRAVTLGLIRLPQSVQVARVLLVGLL